MTKDEALSWVAEGYKLCTRCEGTGVLLADDGGGHVDEVSCPSCDDGRMLSPYYPGFPPGFRYKTAHGTYVCGEDGQWRLKP